MGKLVSTFNETDPEEIISSLQKESKYDFDIDGEIISLENEDFIIDFDASENFAVAKRDNYIVFISTSRNKEMMARGLLDEESLEMVKEKAKELAFLVRVKQVNFTDSCKEYKEDDIDGQKIRISVE
jgi:isoleucyl-tRNA synthetase